MLRSVELNISDLVRSGTDKRLKNNVIDAMRAIDRAHFLKENAYVDSAQPIGFHQTISQPSTVARMLMHLQPQQGNNVLELGTGSGYNACILAYLAAPGKVLSLETVKELAESAKEKIKALGIKNLSIEHMNIFNSSLDQRFDRIIITAGASEEGIIQKLAQKYLNVGGILVCPYQSGPLMIIEKTQGELSLRFTAEEYSFVKLYT